MTDTLAPEIPEPMQGPIAPADAPPVAIPTGLHSLRDVLDAVRPASYGRRLEFNGAPLERIRPEEVAPDVPFPEAGGHGEYVQRPYIPGAHRASAFATFDPTRAGAEFSAELFAAKRAAERWTKAAIEGRPAMLAIVGSTGNGKSHLLYSAAHALADARVDVWCMPWTRLADALRYGGPLPWAIGTTSSARLEGWQLRERMHASRVVLVDEVTGTAGTDFDGQELKKLAVNAADEGVAILITSNVYPLAEVMGAPAADRFAVVQITAPSRRNDP